jgi:hypothetical protein
MSPSVSSSDVSSNSKSETPLSRPNPDAKTTSRGILASFSAGASGGLVASVILQPLDVVKTYQQGSEAQQRYNKTVTANAHSRSGVPCATRAHLLNTSPGSHVAQVSSTPGSLATARWILRERGVVGLWSGLAPSVVRSFFGPGLYFALLDVLVENAKQHQTADSDAPLSPISSFWCSAVARGTAGLLLNPVSVIKVRRDM